jgi:hypothetical protein
MIKTKLPALSPEVTYLGPPEGVEEGTIEDGGLTFPVLWARYRIHGLTVSIGWVVGHVMGSFSDPNKLFIDFDSFDYAMEHDRPAGDGDTRAFEGITTSLLRSIPMAHARALMRERYEQLSVAGVRKDFTFLPSRADKVGDYVHIALAYVALNNVSVEPIKRLAEWTNESVDTWSARLRRARAKGILEGKGRQARIAPGFEEEVDNAWAAMKARREETDGR